MQTFPTVTDFTNAKAYSEAVGIPMDKGDYEVGQVYIANDSRLTGSTYNQPLTNFAVGGWGNTGLEAELQAYVGAPVQVSRRFNYKVWSNAEAFQSETDDLRAVGAEFKEVRIGTSEVSTQTAARGLIMVLDKDEVAEGIMSEQKAVQYLTQRLKRNQIRRAAALLLAAGAGPEARTWLTGTRDADMDVITEINDYQTATGVEADTIVYGRTAWQGRITTLSALASAGAFARAGMTEQQLAAWFKVDQVAVVNTVYQSATATKTVVNTSNVLVFKKSMSGMREDPSNIKYFWSPTDAGGPITAFRYEEGSSKIVVGVKHNELLAITYSGGIQAMTIS